MSKEIIKLSKISKKFIGANKNVSVLKNINLKINSGDLMASLYYAQVLYDEGEEERAVEVLEKIVSSKPNEENFLEDSQDIKDAKDLLEKYK